MGAYHSSVHSRDSGASPRIARASRRRTCGATSDRPHRRDDLITISSMPAILVRRVRRVAADFVAIASRCVRTAFLVCRCCASRSPCRPRRLRAIARAVARASRSTAHARGRSPLARAPSAVPTPMRRAGRRRARRVRRLRRRGKPLLRNRPGAMTPEPARAAFVACSSPISATAPAARSRRRPSASSASA